MQSDEENQNTKAAYSRYPVCHQRPQTPESDGKVPGSCARMAARRLVVSLLAARLPVLYAGILELRSVLQSWRGEHLFSKRALTFTFSQSSTVELRAPFDHLPDMRVSRDKRLRAGFLVVDFGIESTTKTKDLKVSLQFGGELGPGETKPSWSSIVWFSLSSSHVISAQPKA